MGVARKSAVRRQARRPRLPAGLIVVASAVRLEESGKMRLDGKPRLKRADRRIGVDIGRIDEELVAPDESRRAALRDDQTKEALKYVHAIPFPDASQAGMIRERFDQVITNADSSDRPPPA